MKGGFYYDCDDEMLQRYRRSSNEWKLKWLAEMNKISVAVLTPKQIEIRNRIRKGELSGED